MRIDPPFQPGSYPLDAAKTHIPELVSAANEFAFAIYQHSKLPIRVFEAARIATAVINGCTVCKSFRVATGVESLGVEGGVPDNGEAPEEAFYEAILSGNSSVLEQREALAVEYANGMGKDPQGIAIDERFWAEFKTAFTDQEIADLTFCVAGLMGLGRIVHVLGIDNACMINAA